MLNNIALIVAGGSGTRFGSEIAKQYHMLSNGEVILNQTVKTFLKHSQIDLVCVVLNQESNWQMENVIQTLGGKTRQESVRNGLEFLARYCPKNVLIHDAVRPFVSTNIISSVIEQLQHFEAVDIALPITDTIKTYDGQIVPRNQLYATQTPQGFHFDVILNLHKNADKEYTDDISLYLEFNKNSIGIVNGCPKNIKITYKEDI